MGDEEWKSDSREDGAATGESGVVRASSKAIDNGSSVIPGS
jgi:hypothetical protein